MPPRKIVVNNDKKINITPEVNLESNPKPNTQPPNTPSKVVKPRIPNKDTPSITEKSTILKISSKKLLHSAQKDFKESQESDTSFDMFGNDNVDFRYITTTYDFTKNKTLPKITKYELALLIGKRAKQIEEGANPNVNVLSGQSAIEIAEEELRQRKIPLLIRRPNGNTVEYWKPADMQVNMD